MTAKLGDGTTVEADVLVGADGIWSAVRAEMYNEGEVQDKKRTPLSGKKTTVWLCSVGITQHTG